ncbi:hypothetical protein ACU6U9_12655 [Pseudomonas sp. HK3]|jgi:hypothetical protein
MKNPTGFITELFKQPFWVMVWVTGLMTVNLLSLAYWEHSLSQVIMAIFALQTVLMITLYMFYGFEKILGVAHFLWLPLLAYILYTINIYENDYFYYLIVLSFFIGISLVFDVYDVMTYFKKNNNIKS